MHVLAETLEHGVLERAVLGYSGWRAQGGPTKTSTTPFMNVDDNLKSSPNNNVMENNESLPDTRYLVAAICVRSLSFPVFCCVLLMVSTGELAFSSGRCHGEPGMSATLDPGRKRRQQRQRSRRHTATPCGGIQ